MARGRKPGCEKTGGRQKGSKNRRTKDLDNAAAKGITPLDYMLEVMRDEKADDLRRDDMAKAAAPYLHAKRAPEDKSGQTAQMGVWWVDAYRPAALRKNDETKIESTQPPK